MEAAPTTPSGSASGVLANMHYFIVPLIRCNMTFSSFIT